VGPHPSGGRKSRCRRNKKETIKGTRPLARKARAAKLTSPMATGEEGSRNGRGGKFRALGAGKNFARVYAYEGYEFKSSDSQTKGENRGAKTVGVVYAVRRNCSPGSPRWASRKALTR